MTTITVSAPTIVGLAAIPRAAPPHRLPLPCPDADARRRGSSSAGGVAASSPSAAAALGLTPTSGAEGWVPSSGVVVVGGWVCGVGSVCSGGGAPGRRCCPGPAAAAGWSAGRSAARSRSARPRCRSRGRRTARALAVLALRALVRRAGVLVLGRLVGRGRRQEVRDAAGLRRRHVVVAVRDQQEGAQVVADRVEAVERAGRPVDEPQEVSEATALVERLEQARELRRRRRGRLGELAHLLDQRVGVDQRALALRRGRAERGEGGVGRARERPERLGRAGRPRARRPRGPGTSACRPR